MNPRKNARYVQQLNIFFGNQSLCNRFFKKLSGTYNQSCGLYHEPPQVGNSLGGKPVVSFMFIRHKYYDSSFTPINLQSNFRIQTSTGTQELYTDTT